ncbi:hypothetical protein FWK35_00006879 [Aphis craccivora]|uniref:Uncharacterized protein n=1 Tax=Aphis craccivora TaxID=307492 RepID=A0A6G0YTT6_APHCR|nr:hypothetical protein FWK35_00006879 [Aphis craccivora]
MYIVYRYMNNLLLIFQPMLSLLITIFKNTYKYRLLTRSIIRSVNNEKIKKLAKNNLNRIQNIKNTYVNII